MRDRLDRIRALLRENGWDILVVLGRGRIGEYGHLKYASGYCPIIRLGAAVFCSNREPALLLPTPSDIVLSQDVSFIPDIRLAPPRNDVGKGSEMARELLRIIAENGATSQKVAIVGLGDLLPLKEYKDWREYLSGHIICDGTRMFRAMKTQKNDTDREAIRQSAAMVDAGFEALVEVLRAGGGFRKASGAAESVLRENGALESLVYINAGPNYRRRPQPGGPREGDLLTVFVEAADENGYWTELARLLAFGKISQEDSDIGDAIHEAFDVALPLLSSGQEINGVCAAMQRMVEARGLQLHPEIGHGVGIDHDLPEFRAMNRDRLADGTVIAFHPLVRDLSGKRGGSIGETIIISETLCQPVSSHPRQILTL